MGDCRFGSILYIELRRSISTFWLYAYPRSQAKRNHNEACNKQCTWLIRSFTAHHSFNLQELYLIVIIQNGIQDWHLKMCRAQAYPNLYMVIFKYQYQLYHKLHGQFLRKAGGLISLPSAPPWVCTHISITHQCIKMIEVYLFGIVLGLFVCSNLSIHLYQIDRVLRVVTKRFQQQYA